MSKFHAEEHQQWSQVMQATAAPQEAVIDVEAIVVDNRIPVTVSLSWEALTVMSLDVAVHEVASDMSCPCRSSQASWGPARPRC